MACKDCRLLWALILGGLVVGALDGGGALRAFATIAWIKLTS